MDEFETWVQASYPLAYRTACLLLGNPADAEEAVQEAFLKVWRFRGSLPDGSGRQAWLYRVVVNTCHSRRRSEGARPRVVAPLDEDRPVTRETGEADEVVRALDVQAALASLPEQLRVVVVLSFYVGLVDREIGLAIGRRPGTARARLAEARRRLAADPRLAAFAPAIAKENR